MMSSAVALVLTFLTVAGATEEKRATQGPFFEYIPSLLGNGATATLMTSMCIGSLIYMYTGPKRDNWAWVFPAGTGFMGVGSWGRLYLRSHNVFMVYRISSLQITCLPVSLLAMNYIVFGKFITAIQGHENAEDVPGEGTFGNYSPISAQKVKMMFVTSDLVTLFIVTTGSALQLSTYHDLTVEGAHIFLFGTILQVLSYGIFTVLVIVTHCRMIKQDSIRFRPFNFKEPCVVLFFMLYVSGACILVRSFYRLVEAILGIHSTLTTHEVYYLILDAAPLCIAGGVWMLRWPGTILRQIQQMAPAVVLDNSRCEVMQPEPYSIKMEDDDDVWRNTFDSNDNHKRFKV